MFEPICKLLSSNVSVLKMVIVSVFNCLFVNKYVWRHITFYYDWFSEFPPQCVSTRHWRMTSGSTSHRAACLLAACFRHCSTPPPRSLRPSGLNQSKWAEPRPVWVHTRPGTCRAEHWLSCCLCVCVCLCVCCECVCREVIIVKLLLELHWSLLFVCKAIITTLHVYNKCQVF